MQQEGIRFNTFFDRQQDFLYIIPGKYAGAWGVILCAILGPYMLLCQVIQEHLLAHCLVGALLLISLITYTLLVKDGESKFFGEFHKPKQYARTNQRIKLTPTSLKPKVPTMTARVTKEKIRAIENELDIVCPFEFRYQGEMCGGFVVEKNETIRFIFCYELHGVSSTASPEEISAIGHTLAEGFKDFNFDEFLTISQGTWSEDLEGEIAHLDQLIAETDSEEVEFLLQWRKRSTNQLIDSKIQRSKRVSLFFSYTPDQAETVYQLLLQGIGEVARLLAPLLRALRLAPKRRSVLETLETKCYQAFEAGYTTQKFFLDRLGLKVRPLGWYESWQLLWSEVNKGHALKPPKVLKFSGEGVKWVNNSDSVVNEKGEIISGDEMVVSCLFRRGAPEIHKSFVYLPGRDQYCGGLVWNSKPNLTWQNDHVAQFHYAVKPLVQGESYDTKITVQITKMDTTQARRTAAAITSETNMAMNAMNETRVQDRGIVYESRKAIEADDALRNGVELVKMGWVCTVYRKNTQELARSINHIAMMYPEGVLQPEMGYFGSLWFETLPCNFCPMLKGGPSLTSKFERRLNVNTYPMLGFVPLFRDISRDKIGVKFLSISGTPIYFNPLSSAPHGHCITTATTGGGKTVLMGATLADAYCRGANTYFFDASKDGNSGAIAPLVKFLGGGYFDPSHESANLFQGADWRKIEDPEKRVNAQTVFRSFLISSIKDLTLRGTLQPDGMQKAKNLLVYLVPKYLERPEIISRYEAAYDGGIHSPAWQNIPTLMDFSEWIKSDVKQILPEEFLGTEMVDILREISAGLRILMSRPSGLAISQPSSFDTSSRVIAFKVDTKGSDDDVLPLIISAQSIVLSGALNAKQTYVLYDEVSALFKKFPSLADTAADITSMGRSLQIWINLMGQTIDPILECSRSADLFNNIKTYLTGYVTADAIEGLVIRNIPRHLVEKAATDYFLTKGKSRWILTQGSHHMIGDYHIDSALLALLANSKTENATRREFEEKYPDKFEATNRLATYLEGGADAN